RISVKKNGLPPEKPEKLNDGLDDLKLVPDQEQNPKIKEGELVGIPIQSCHDLIWSNCGYLLVFNDKETIKFLEKERDEPHYFQLETEIRAEGQFMEDIFYYGELKYFVPTNIIESQNNFLKISIEPKQYYSGLVDTLTFQGEKINQYRDFIELSDEKTTSHKPEKTIPEIKKDLEKYYRENNIKSIKLSDEDKELMDIVFNSGEKKVSNTFSNRRDKQKLEQVKIYLKSNNKEILNYSELGDSSIVNPSRNSNKGNGEPEPMLHLQQSESEGEDRQKNMNKSNKEY
ncbi:6482_t:CDS:2, partial [Racocetra persica]